MPSTSSSSGTSSPSGSIRQTPPAGPRLAIMKLRSGSSAKPFGRNCSTPRPQDQLGRPVVMDPGDAAAAIRCEHVAPRRDHDAFRPRQIPAEKPQIGAADRRRAIPPSAYALT